MPPPPPPPAAAHGNVDSIILFKEKKKPRHSSPPPPPPHLHRHHQRHHHHAHLSIFHPHLHHLQHSPPPPLLPRYHPHGLRAKPHKPPKKGHKLLHHKLAKRCGKKKPRLHRAFLLADAAAYGLLDEQQDRYWPGCCLHYDQRLSKQGVHEGDGGRRCHSRPPHLHRRGDRHRPPRRHSPAGCDEEGHHKRGPAGVRLRSEIVGAAVEGSLAEAAEAPLEPQPQLTEGQPQPLELEAVAQSTEYRA
ncbi:hypothetical protein L7F22_043330 [Adiantum nelumboides]|nr:hypothetical protein [Adiantum nelumboides]